MKTPDAVRPRVEHGEIVTAAIDRVKYFAMQRTIKSAQLSRTSQYPINPHDKVNSCYSSDSTTIAETVDRVNPC